MKSIAGDIDHILISEDQLKNAVSELAGKIDKYYGESEKRLLLLGILKGSVVFMGDILKAVKIPVEIDFMKVSSYHGTTSSHSVNIILDLHRKDLSDTDILVVEDIVDSGNTLSYLVDYLKLKGANSVKTCTLLDKPERREVEFEADWTCFTIPNEFVVGYGLDYDEKYRALPFIGVLKKEVYTK